MKPTDVQVVKSILDEMKGWNSEEISRKIVRVLGKRIRQRCRDRSQEDFNQAAFRSVRETVRREIRRNLRALPEDERDLLPEGALFVLC